MEQLNNDIFPCLKAVGSWWTDADRRLLFCHLMSIFQFDENYLTTLPASMVHDSFDTYRLDASSIKSDYRLFEKNLSTKKINCSSIRKLSFSFGKFNHRLCFLCPYSTTFKNSSRASETRFLYHLMNHGAASFDSYLDTTDKELSFCFSSYFPIFIHNILIDAFPFEIVASKFLGISSDYYLSAPKNARHLLIEKLATELEHKFNYAKLRSHFLNAFPDFSSQLKDCALLTIKAIEYDNYNTRPANAIIVKRLFHSLCEERRKYKPKPVSEYLAKVLEPLNPELFQSKVLFSQDDYKKIDSLYEKPASSLEFVDETVDEHLSILTATDDELLSSDIEDALLAATRVSSTTKGENTSARLVNNVTLTPSKTDTSEFLDYYVLTDTTDIHILGNVVYERDESIFKAFISNSLYLCMEPAIYNTEAGLIISNDTNDLLFYPISKLGNRMLRKLSEHDTSIYTSNIYHTGCLLYANSIYYLKLKDVGLAKYFYTNSIPKGIDDLTTIVFPKCLNEYQKIYEDSRSCLDSDLIHELNLYEAYNSILCMDGVNLPFKNLSFLYAFKDSVHTTYNFSKDIKPITNGLLLSLSAYLNELVIEEDILCKLYMQVCVELHKHFPFHKHLLYILNLNENGILIYMTGSNKKLQKIRLFLTSCARRIFSKYSTKDHPVTFEERTHLYDQITLME